MNLKLGQHVRLVHPSLKRKSIVKGIETRIPMILAGEITHLDKKSDLATIKLFQTNEELTLPFTEEYGKENHFFLPKGQS